MSSLSSSLSPGTHIDHGLLVAALAAHGLLLVQDPALPSVAGLIAGGPVRGSWWAHPSSHAIYAGLNELLAHSDVLRVKLVSSKVTLVHRRLWGAVVAVATAREAWQTDGLGGEARALLARVDALGSVPATGAPAKALERALLVHATEVHTTSGAHATVLARWTDWPGAAGLAPVAPRAGRIALEGALDAMNTAFAARGTLPWRR